MFISTLRNVELGVEGLLVRWTGSPPPPEVPGVRKAVKNKLVPPTAICLTPYSAAWSMIQRSLGKVRSKIELSEE